MWDFQNNKNRVYGESIYYCAEDYVAANIDNINEFLHAS